MLRASCRGTKRLWCFEVWGLEAKTANKAKKAKKLQAQVQKEAEAKKKEEADKKKARHANANLDTTWNNHVRNTYFSKFCAHSRFEDVRTGVRRGLRHVHSICWVRSKKKLTRARIFITFTRKIKETSREKIIRKTMKIQNTRCYFLSNIFLSDIFNTHSQFKL